VVKHPRELYYGRGLEEASIFGYGPINNVLVTRDQAKPDDDNATYQDLALTCAGQEKRKVPIYNNL
jgi:hypothetical protein